MALHTITGTAFSNTANQQPTIAGLEAPTHVETQWQVAESPSFLPDEILEDTWFQTSDLTSFTFDFPRFSVSYVRARYRDSYGIVSDWSTTVEVDLLPIFVNRRRFFFGRRSANAILLADTSLLDHGEPYDLLIRTDIMAPAGLGGECVFLALFVKTMHLNAQQFTVTPIIDGLRSPDVTVSLPTVADTQSSDVTEIGLYAQLSPRVGIRGASLQVELLVPGPITDEWWEAHGLEVEYVPVREAYPVIQPTAILAQVPTLISRRRLFAGERNGNRLFNFMQGRDDGGEPVVARVETNEVAPAGEAGACIFTYAYLVFTRANPTDLMLLVTPIVDNVEQDAQLIVLAGVTDVVTSVTEMRLHTLYNNKIRRALRGIWIRLRIETVYDLPDGDIWMEGCEVEFEEVTESRPQQVPSAT